MKAFRGRLSFLPALRPICGVRVRPLTEVQIALKELHQDNDVRGDSALLY
jgi:hypothetical protein